MKNRDYHLYLTDTEYSRIVAALSRLNRCKNVEEFTAVWVWAEKLSDNGYEIYIGYA